MKKITALGLIFILLFSITSFGAFVDGSRIYDYKQGAHTMVSSEELAKSLDLIYSFDGESYSLTEPCSDALGLKFYKENNEKVYHISYKGEKDSLKELSREEKDLPCPFAFIDGKLYVPFRYVCEYFGTRVYFDENKGAYAQRGKYYSPKLISSDGNERSIIGVGCDVESAVIAGNYLIYISGDKMFKRNLETEETSYLFKSGKAHASGDSLFVLSQGSVFLVDIETGKNTKLCENVNMVGYTEEDYAWCETLSDGILIFDNKGNKIETIKGHYAEAFDYKDGYVYYTDVNARLFREKTDGSKKEELAKAALYPVLKDGYVYYSDMALNFRRVNVDTKEDMMVYGLNLEYMITLKDKYILNFYSEDGNHKMFVSNPDGTEFELFSGGKIATVITPILYKDGILIKDVKDGYLYYAKKDGAQKISEDLSSMVCGVYKDKVYYIVK